MIKIICDVCKKEISETGHRKVLAYFKDSLGNSLDGQGYGNLSYFLKLEQVHLACAKEVRQVIKEAVEKYLNRFSAKEKS